MHASMATIPRLVSVVEIIKREYLKTLDATLAGAGLLSGLHQYNEITSLEAEGLVTAAEDEEQGRLEAVARALQGKNQYVVLPLSCGREGLRRAQREGEEDGGDAGNVESEGDPGAGGARGHVSLHPSRSQPR